MARNTTLLGALLTILGLGTFALLRFSPTKWTALLPALFGIVFLVLGILAQIKPAWRHHLLHAATALALVAFLGSVPGLLQVAVLVSGGMIDRPASALEQSIAAFLCVAFLISAIKSFIMARRTLARERA